MNYESSYKANQAVGGFSSSPAAFIIFCVQQLGQTFAEQGEEILGHLLQLSSSVLRGVHAVYRLCLVFGCCG